MAARPPTPVHNFLLGRKPYQKARNYMSQGTDRSGYEAITLKSTPIGLPAPAGVRIDVWRRPIVDALTCKAGIKRYAYLMDVYEDGKKRTVNGLQAMEEVLIAAGSKVTAIPQAVPVVPQPDAVPPPRVLVGKPRDAVTQPSVNEPAGLSGRTSAVHRDVGPSASVPAVPHTRRSLSAVASPVTERTATTAIHLRVQPQPQPQQSAVVVPAIVSTPIANRNASVCPDSRPQMQSSANATRSPVTIFANGNGLRQYTAAGVKPMQVRGRSETRLRPNHFDVPDRQFLGHFIGRLTLFQDVAPVLPCPSCKGWWLLCASLA